MRLYYTSLLSLSLRDEVHRCILEVEQGRLLRFYPFEKETEATVYLPGVVLLSRKRISGSYSGDDFAELKKAIGFQETPHTFERVFVYHVNNICVPSDRLPAGFILTLL